MNYENASDIIPENLLTEIQKYAAGKLLYIPTGEEKRGWGEKSGYRNQLQRRNIMIRNKYANGVTVSELADEYFLSLDSIKKIIYSKKDDRQFTYAPTVLSAVQYANIGMLEEWIYCYMLHTQNAVPGLHDCMSKECLYFGVVKFPLRLIELDESMPGNDCTDEDPPLLIQYIEGKFHCIEQKNVLAALKQRKVNAYPTIIVLKETADYKRFMRYYENVLFYINQA
ncbi:CD3324 family protein [Paenibacillus sp. MDMC362]|uniref:CD3324 family protein n=1 Tax=Paenibacillus sp. MDMC362 TaxID=2977365 RepID=UPI0015EC4E8F|nr:CD3324 family protein [Paenibacillus sp. MDMC362]